MEYSDKDIEDGFEKAGGRMSEIETTLRELKRLGDAHTSQLKLVKALGRSLSSDEQYRGFWPNEGMAKDFGCLVAKICGINTKDMSTTVNSEGGITVPDELANWIIDKLGVYGKYRRNALTVRIGSSRQVVPKITSDLVVYCPGEGKEITKSDVSFAGVGMNVRKFCCLAVVNRELEEDSLIGIGEIVGLSMARSMAKKEDLIGFLGDGTEDYFGMTGIIPTLQGIDSDPANIPGLVVGSGNAYSELTLDDFEKVAGVLPEDAEEGAKWFMSKKFFYNVPHKLARASGAANLFEILSGKRRRELLGYPVEFVSCMPSTEANSQVCAILGDLKIGAFLGERKTLDIARSDDVYFVTDQIGIRGTQRIDICLYGVGDTEEAGPIVGLITAGS